MAPMFRWIAQISMTAAYVSCCVGCYDGDDLIHRASSTALRTSMAEVDLGSFHTTLPRDSGTASLTEIRLHIFAAVPRYHVSEVEERLQAESFLLRHEVLTVVRNSTPSELAEPSLARLRKRLQDLVNNILDEDSVKSVGFYDFALRRT
jgi:hypothetical protein